MITVAITGSFAAGKSFVLNYLKNMGFKTFSADEYVAKLYRKQKIQRKILELFPTLESFDKKKIAALIYNNRKALDRINAFIHPFVANAIKNFKLQNHDEKIIFAEVPLLFESNFVKYFDFVVTTFCSEKSRLQRAKARKGFNKEIYDKIGYIQIPQDEKVKKADFVLNTDCNLVELELKIHELKKILMWKSEKLF